MEKRQLGHPPTFTIPRKDLVAYQDEDNFDKKVWMEWNGIIISRQYAVLGGHLNIISYYINSH